MKKILIGLLILAVILAGCSTQKNSHNENADDLKGLNEECGANVGHTHDELEPCTPDGHDHPTIDLPSGGVKTTSFSSLTADIVTAKIGDKEVTMYAYNGMIPGPTVIVNQGDEFDVKFTNNLDSETTVHWHGLRHDNKDDGVPGVTQEATQPGESHTYSLKFPDYGSYWYHPHVREDKQQDLGLAGLIIVKPKEDVNNNVDREEFIILDDLLVNENGIVPFPEVANHAIMGRFGNVQLVNGVVDYHFNAKAGETIRFYIANVANVRPFNISFDGAQIKRVGSDMSLYQQETFEDSIIIAPAERYIVEVQFKEERSYNIIHQTPHGYAHLGSIVVEGETEALNFALKTEDKTDIAEYAEYFNKEIDHTITLDLKMPMGMMNEMDDDQMMGGQKMETHMGGDTMMDKKIEPIEWEDEMNQMNKMSNTDMITWILRDETGAENMDITLNWKVGDKVKIRIVNDENSAHPMQHPIHLHGQRFVVTSIDGVEVENKVWKDTALIPTGATVDILVDVTNPGTWMMHCHIAEHLEAGMMAEFSVEA